MSSEQAERIGYSVTAKGAVSEVVQVLTKELSAKGFGILSNIDVQKIIKEKLGQSMNAYVILDVCNPRHAKKAIDGHKEVGLILPCKIIVFEDGGRMKISLYKPMEAIKAVGFTDLASLAYEVEEELKGAIDASAAKLEV